MTVRYLLIALMLSSLVGCSDESSELARKEQNNDLTRPLNSLDGLGLKPNLGSLPKPPTI